MAGSVLGVLDGERNASEWARVPAGRDQLVDRRCLLEGELGVERDERVDGWIEGLDAIDGVRDELAGAEPARADLAG